MTHEFVFINKLVKPTFVIVNYNAFQSSAQTESHLTESVNFLFVSNRSSGGNFLFVNLRRNFKVTVLYSYKRMRIYRSETHAKTVIRQSNYKTLALLAVCPINFFQMNFLPFGRLFDSSRRLYHSEKIYRISLHYRRFFGVNFNFTIIYAAYVYRAHQMLNGENLCAIFLQSRRSNGSCNIRRQSVDFWIAGQISPNKNYSCVLTARFNFQANFFSRM